MIPVDIRNQSLESVVAKPQTSRNSSRGGSRWGARAVVLLGSVALLAAACTDSGKSKPQNPPPSWKDADLLGATANLNLCVEELTAMEDAEQPADYKDKYAQSASTLRRILNSQLGRTERGELNVSNSTDACVTQRGNFFNSHRSQPRAEGPDGLSIGYDLRVGHGQSTTFRPIHAQTTAEYGKEDVMRGFTAMIFLFEAKPVEFPTLAPFIDGNQKFGTKMPAGSEIGFAKAMLNLPDDTTWISQTEKVYGKGKLADGTPYLVEVRIGNEGYLTYREGAATIEHDDSKKSDVLNLFKKYLGITDNESSDYNRQLLALKPASDQNGEVVWSIPHPYAVESGITAKVQYGPNGELLRAQFEGDRLAKEAFDRRRFRLDRQPTLKEESSIIFGASIENTRFTEAAGIVRGTIIKYGETEAEDQDDLQFTITSNGFQATISFESLAGTKSLAPQAKQANFEQKFHPHKFAANGFLKPQYSPRKLGL